ncbi:hypothetical protein [Kitasatospora kifunensis]|uniref:Uncharacterized protein n=1 Tax=Kitasatospora kifunensis TaxID=58351 RepID=A0A7W7RBS9_KITKI|nr:hypothetical protein [Kitasatospora kifunensis]MBB4929034.1 hypothetical protein [Kitasatospora kifunensis]
MSITTLSVRIGEPDIECRYPVIIGADRVIGLAFRWHRNWNALLSDGTEKDLGRPATGQKGIDMAVAWLTEEYAAGRIGAIALDMVRAEAPQPLDGEVPLLHPRMAGTEGKPASLRNIQGAKTALAGLAEHHWKPVLHGFPGSDNPWFLECLLCGWSGVRYWSHLRGRNGEPPRIYRHDGGCIGEDKIRELIPAYQA